MMTRSEIIVERLSELKSEISTATGALMAVMDVGSAAARVDAEREVSCLLCEQGNLLDALKALDVLCGLINNCRTSAVIFYVVQRFFLRYWSLTSLPKEVREPRGGHIRVRPQTSPSNPPPSPTHRVGFS